MSLSKQEVSEYRRLKDSGVDVTDTNRIRYNSGSETSRHVCLKSLAGLVAIQNGYRVDSEVLVETRRGGSGEIDVLTWGHESRLTYAVEVQASPTDEIKADKRDTYVRHTAIDDMLMVNLNAAPQDMSDAYGWIADELGLTV